MGILQRLRGRPAGDHNGADDETLVSAREADEAAARVMRAIQGTNPEPEPVVEEPAVPEHPVLDSGAPSTAGTAVAGAHASVVQIADTSLDHAAPSASPPAEHDAAVGGSPPAPIETHVSCPYCTNLLDPPPERTRRCPFCRQQVIVRHSEGRTVYLTEAALVVFDAERQREADQIAWTDQRREWLRLATSVRAPAARRARIAAAPLTEATVKSARMLYLAGADLAVRAARNEKRWQDVGRIRREQAAALWAEAGGTVPPPQEVVDLHEEGMLAELRSMTRNSRDAELISARCCKTCRADDGKAFQIAAELKVPRLPHVGCPKGICKCEWWPTMIDPNLKSRRGKSARRPTRADAVGSTPEPPTAPVEAPYASVVIEVSEPNS